MVALFEKEENYELTLAVEKDKYSGQHGSITCFLCMTDIFNAYIQCTGCAKEHNNDYFLCPKCFTSHFSEDAQVPGNLTDYGEDDMNKVFPHSPDTNDQHKKYVCGFRLYTPKAQETDFCEVCEGCEKARKDCERASRDCEKAS